MLKNVFLFWITGLILLLAAATSVFAEELFHIVDGKDATPFKSIDPAGKPEGIFYDILSSAFKRMNVPYNYEVYPWERAQYFVKTKKADALITVPTPERLKYLTASKETVFTAVMKIFTQRNNANIAQIRSATSLSDLKGLKFVDFIGDGWAEEALKQFDIDWSPNLVSAIRKITANRGDVMIENETVVLHTIRAIRKNRSDFGLEFDQLISFDAPVAPISFHLLIRNDSEYLYLLPEFDKTIRVMRKEGELNRIRDKWIK